MINLNPTAIDIAAAAMRHQYDDITSRAELIDFAHSFADDNDATDLRTLLISMIDLDLNDMIHNSNLDFYATIDELDTLNDDEFDTLADHLTETTDPDIIADALLARFPA